MTTLDELNDKAGRIARDAVKVEMARHRPETGVIGTFCYHDRHQWPCPTVEALSGAEEAIAEAEEEAERIASGPYYCGVEVRPMRYVDPEPAEYCENEVEHEGDLCVAHEGAARADAERDDDAYERMKDARYDD